VLAFFEHTSLFHPKDFTARSGFHRNVALEVEGNAIVRQFKRRLDAAAVTNVLMDRGVSHSLRFNDPNGLILELTADIPHSLEYERFSRSSAHSVLQRWLHYREYWWRNAAGMEEGGQKVARRR
jgi:hypothetical protein